MSKNEPVCEKNPHKGKNRAEGKKSTKVRIEKNPICTKVIIGQIKKVYESKNN